MKKRFRRLLRWNNTIVLLLSLILCFVTSCTDEKEVPGNKYGVVAFDVQTDATFTKSVDESTTKGYLNPAEYIIQIWDNEGDLVEEFLLGDEIEIELEAGDYVASATWGEDIAAGLGEDFIYMEGSKNFIIEEEKTTDIQLAPVPGNAKVVVSYSEELEEFYSDYYIHMTTSHNKDNPLLYSKEEVRPAFFRVNSQGQNLVLDIRFYDGEEEYKFSHTELINPRDSVRFAIDLEEGEDPGPEPEVKSPSITTDIVYYSFPAENPEQIEVEVETNCESYSFTQTGDWYTVYQSQDKKQLLIRTTANTTENERSGKITLQASNEKGLAVTYISLSQKAKGDNGGGGIVEPYIFAMADSISAKEFDEYQIIIRTNDESWTAELESETDKSWLEIDTEDNIIFVSTLNDNKGEEPRTAKIILTAAINEGTANDTIAVTQIVPDPVIDAISFVQFESTAGDQQIDIDSNTNWDYSYPEEDKSWLTVEQNSEGLKISVKAIESEASRSSIITLIASTNDGRTTYHNITVEQNGLNKPKLKLSITIDNERTVVVLDEDYELEDPGLGKPTISYDGFNPGAIKIQKEKARSYFMNVRIPSVIKSARLTYISGSPSYDLLDDENGSGTICSINQKGTLGVIYLDTFFNSLDVATHVYTLTITDQMDVEESVMLIINVEE